MRSDQPPSSSQRISWRPRLQHAPIVGTPGMQFGCRPPRRIPKSPSVREAICHVAQGVETIHASEPDFAQSAFLKRAFLATTQVLVAICLLVLAPSQSGAQDDPKETATPPTSDSLNEIPGPVRVRDVGGQVVAEPVEVMPVLPGDALPYFLSKLDLHGVVIDNRAELSAEIHISITRDNIWQEVKLRLPEAHVVAADYEGNGQQTMAKTTDRSEGLTWKFRGAGEHRLFLELEVPLKRATNGQKLDLTLPKLESVFRGNLSLEIPSAPLDVTPVGADLKPIEVVNGKTRIEATVPGVNNPGSGSQVSLAWTKRSPTEAGKISFAQTEIDLRVDAERKQTQLDVRQKLRSSDRLLSSMKMTIPDGFQVVGVTGPRFVEYRDGVDSDGQAYVTVSFDDEPSDSAELTWLMSRSFSEETDSLLIDGFEIDSVDRHRTIVTVIRNEEFRLSVNWDEVVGAVQRPPLLPDALVGLESTTYPFAIPIEIREERPSISVAPFTRLTLRSAEAEIRTRFRIAVDRGAVDELTLNWSTNPRGNWTTLRLENPAGQLYEADGRTRIRLDQPHRGEFTVDLFAVRELNDETTTSLSLPSILAESVVPTQLSVYAVDSVDADLGSVGESRLDAISNLAGQEVATGPQDETTTLNTRLLSTYIVTGQPADVRVSRSIRKMTRSATAIIDLQGTRLVGTPDLGIKVAQTIDYSVRYGRARDVLLRIPPQLTSGLTRAAAIDESLIRIDGIPAKPSQVEAAGDDTIRLLLDSPQSRVRIEIGPYPLQFDPDSKSTPTLPLVAVEGLAYESLKCRVRRASMFRIAPDRILASGPSVAEDQWTETALTPTDSVTWVHDKPPREAAGIELTIETGPEAVQSLFGVRLAETEIVRDIAGISVRSEYDIVEAPDALALGVPVDSESVRFTWNGEPVGDAQRLDPSTGERAVTYQIPTNGLRSGRLIVQFRHASALNTPIRSESILLPILPPGAWIEESLIEFVSVPNRHLISARGPVTPEFQWHRNGLIWSRKSGKRLSFTSLADDTQGNRYLFSSSVSPQALEVVTTQGALLIFCGAATTFGIAFLLYVFPKFRQLPLMLGMGIVAAFVGLLNPVILQVLFQPAALGIVLALVAIGIDRFRLRDEQPSPVLAVYSESDYSVPSVVSGARGQRGYAETVVRETPRSLADLP